MRYWCMICNCSMLRLVEYEEPFLLTTIKLLETTYSTRLINKHYTYIDALMNALAITILICPLIPYTKLKAYWSVRYQNQIVCGTCHDIIDSDTIAYRIEHICTTTLSCWQHVLFSAACKCQNKIPLQQLNDVPFSYGCISRKNQCLVLDTIIWQCHMLWLIEHAKP